MRANDGAWIGWSGGSDDDIEPFVDDGLSLVPVPLSAEEVEEFYEGFSNATLWPLYHDVVAKPEFHREWWDAYVRVNRRFAQKAAELAAEDATVWVHDYQMQLVPAMLRELRPDLRIGFFLHIPFPPAELFQQLPWRRQLLEGLLGADVVGFQRPGASQNFVRLVRQRVGPQDAPRPRSTCPTAGSCRPASFPISIDTAGLDELARTEAVDAAGQGDPRAARQPAEGAARRRPARLHQGHLRPAARVRRAGPRRRALGRGRRLRAGRDPVAGARRAVPPAPRRDRPAGRPAQRRPRHASAARRSTTCTRPTPGRRWRRCSGPPT